MAKSAHKTERPHEKGWPTETEATAVIESADPAESAEPVKLVSPATQAPVTSGVTAPWLGEEVSQEFLDYIVAEYKGQYIAQHPTHEEPADDDATLLATLEEYEVRGGSDACRLAWADARGVELPLPGSGTAPTVTMLVPDSVVLGAPSFTLSVQGTGFTPGAIIVFNGFDEPTIVLSDSEVTTGVDMGVWLAPATVPVAVRTGAGTSPTLDFTFLAT